MTQPARFSRPQMILHWVVAVLFLFNYFVSDGLGRAAGMYARGEDYSQYFAAIVHPWVGVALFVAVLARIVLRFTVGAPAEPEMPAWMSWAAKLTHGAIYASLLVLCASGIARWFFGVRDAGDVHEIFVNVTVFLIVAHIAAALYHQFILKDNLLARMR